MPQPAVSDRIGDEVCRYIAWHWRELNFPPSIRDIQKALGVKSTATVHNCLLELEIKGRIQRDPYRRTLIVVNGVDPEICNHDWRITNRDFVDTGEALIECLYCCRRTAVEYCPDWNNKAACPRYMGEMP